MLRWIHQLFKSGGSPTNAPSTLAAEAATVSTGASPQNAMMALAIRHEKAGQISQALSACESLAIARPNDLDVLCLLGKLRIQQGNLDGAATVLAKAVSLDPKSTEAMLQSGRLHHKRAEYEAATRFFEAILQLDPNHAGAHFGLGNVDLATGQLDAALAHFTSAIACNPQHAEAHCNRGVIYERKRDPRQAAEAYERALAINPALGIAHFNLGRLLMAAGELQRALHHVGKVVALDPSSADDWDIKGRLHHAVRDLEPAKEAYERALAIDPNLYEVHNNLGVVCQMLGQYDAGIKSFQAALASHPAYVTARSNLGIAFLSMGKRDDALGALRQAVRDAPNDPSIYSNYLFCVSHDEQMSAKEVFDEHRRFGDRFEAPFRAHWPHHVNSRNPDRRLRVGFVSADLYAHAASTFIEPIWSALDQDKFEIWAYANNTNEDAVTHRLKQWPKSWKAVSAMNDDDFARCVQEDEIDILFDLSGHSTGNRLPVFARKPAPIQVSWIGNPNTTGLTAIDYYLADRFCAPPGLMDALFTEKIVQLACTATFQPHPGAPEVSELPALRGESFTFASFARSNKITEGTIRLWGRVLNAVPNSRMLIGGLSDPARMREITDQFELHGVNPDRLLFRPRMSIEEYLALHADVDLIMDTFPFGGGTTTCHALWMGVPILSLTGGTMSSRVGAVLNGQIGLPDFTVDTEAEFVRLAEYWANNLDKLSSLRATLRSRCASSALLQPSVVARSLEAAMRQMWVLWCGDLPSRSFSVDRDT